MRWLLAAGASCLLFGAAVLGTFAPLRDADGIQYLFAWPRESTLLRLSAFVIVSLAVLFAAVIHAATRRGPADLDLARSGRWLAPLCVLSVVAVGLGPAVPGVGAIAAPLGYFFYELRWWWLAGAMIAMVVRADHAIGGPLDRRIRSIGRWPTAPRLLLIDSLLFASVIVWAIVSTPRLRFSGELHGDETKYIRYCEVWYQGGGFDISSKQLFTDQALDASPAVHRIGGLVLRGLGEEIRALATDVRQFAADPSGFRWNRGTGDDAFVRGKHGGVYQIYQPGLSFALFPGYVVDRYLLGLQPGYQDEFPAELVMTNLTVLLIYGGCVVALFRLLRRALGSDVLAALWAGLAVVTLPTSAFAFQFYPELPALLIIVLGSTYAMFAATEAGVATAAASGGAVAFLAWLHPRFLLVSLLLVGLGAFRSKPGARRALVAFACAIYLSVGAFDYRVTGSWLPTALWDASRPNEAVHPWAIPINLLGYAFHRTWGLAAHAPILLGVVPGLLVLARQSRRDAAFVGAIALALVVPAAGHTLSAAGGTPGRLVLAVVPLLVWPVAVLVRRFWDSATMRAMAVAAIVLSLDAGLSYNWSHEKSAGPLRAMGLSGWRPNLAFPITRDAGWDSPANLIILLAVIAFVIAGALFAFVRSAEARPAATGAFHGVAPLGALTVLVALSIASTAATGHWFYDAYLLDRITAQRVAARGLLASDRCRVCFTSRERAIDWTELEPNPARGTASHARIDGSTVMMDVAVEGDGPWTGFGRVRVDFGDQSATKWTGVVGAWQVAHVYRRPGEYPVSVWLQLRDGEVRVERQTIRIGG